MVNGGEPPADLSFWLTRTGQDVGERVDTIYLTGLLPSGRPHDRPWLAMNRGFAWFGG